MKSRTEAAEFITKQLSSGDYKCLRNKGGHLYYGRQELRELMDFIYGDPPKNDEEKI